MSFKLQNVNNLKGFLQKRGVTCYFYRKDHLVKLCDLALELQLPILNEENDVEPDITISSLTRRTLVIGGKEVIAPEVSSVVWSVDLRFIPNIEIGDILVYMLNYCGWSGDKLKSYKRDNGYQLFQANHIDSVKISPQFDGNCYYVGGTCVPETRQKECPYDVWILVRPSGEIVSGGCSCVAGNGACKHCIALLFSIESFSERHRDRFTQACTDVVCTWDKPKKKSEPMEIDEMEIRRDTSTKLKRTPMTKNYKPASTMEHRSIEKDLYKLFSGTDSLVLQVLDPPSDASEDEAEAEIPTLSDAVSSCSLSEGKSLASYLQTVYSDSIISKIEELTRGQSDNDAWFEHRKGRITASLFHSVCHFRFNDKPTNYILKKLLGQEKMLSCPSVNFGKRNEPVARQFYNEMYRTKHKNVQIDNCGLYVCTEFPFMGATPDGVVSCSCCGKGLLEIKCSFMHQNENPLDACLDSHYHVYKDENNCLRLKESSSWHTQIQGQMGICKRQWCDFVFFTKKGIAVDRIIFDKNQYNDIIVKCEKFFHKYVVQAIQSD
ncbi:uncharacterized protein LOC143066777 [Mytilus galloprovincialis]|uniref:uncharacterized protein LOC143066777 n=1 Tax=Mytilus galloprovincialis TaxID=29158 RepID=UPI003F7C5D02